MSIGDLFSVPSGPYNALRKGMGQAGQQISAADEAAIKALMTGQQQATSAFQAGEAPWKTIMGEAGGFLPLYAGALGAGTPAQNQAAQGAFQASPGYQYTLGQGLEGLSRAGASSGQLGQLNMDAMKYAQNLSDQDFQQWLNNLFRGVGVGTQAAQGIQTGQGEIGQAALGTGQGISGVRQAQGSDLANLILGRAGIPLQKQQAEAQTGANALSALFGLGGMATGLAGAFNPPVTNIYGA